LRRLTALLSSRFLRSRYLLAACGGLLLAMAFPLPGIAGLAWVAPGMMIAAGFGQPCRESFRIGYFSGLVFYLVSLYWLLLIPYRWLGIPFGPAAGWLALAGYLALYPAVWIWLMTRFTPQTWWQRTVWALLGGVAWVGLEMVVGRLFSGFPWNPLGASQYRLTPLIQVASITGVYGVSFLVVWTSLSLFSAARAMLRAPHLRSTWPGEMILPLLAVAVVFNFGLRQLRHVPEAPERILRIALVQPSIPQTLIWDSGSSDERFAELLKLSRQAVSNRVDLLIWPEAAVPKLLRYDGPTFDAVTGLARENKVWMIIGADDAEPRQGAEGKGENEYSNSSFLISPNGKLLERYRKRNLVIFGEYIPLARWLPFLKWFTPIEGGFTPGDRVVPFEMPNLGATTAVLICFEDVFPWCARDAASTNTQFLINLTNDGWFGEGAAQWQHAISGLFRAVENRVALVRSCNNGLTCWIDEHGRIRQILRNEVGSPYAPGVMHFELPLGNATGTVGRTFYHRHGDLFGWSCLAITALMVAMKWRPWKRKEE
jgi:apolipoprotein N-acyltransferase